MAFLRGINVGGKNTVGMGELRDTVAGMGFENVRTVMATGNLIVEGSSPHVRRVGRKLEKELSGRLGRRVGVLVRSADYLQKLAAAAPFGSRQATARQKLYVTFAPVESDSRISIRGEDSPDGVEIVYTTRGEVFTALDLSISRTPNLMSFLEEQMGPGITTRSWGTIQKVLDKLDSH